MLPATVSLAQYFYPIGNTTPNDLAQTAQPRADADILLLGCGDLRNVLFTLHCRGVASLSDGKRLPFSVKQSKLTSKPKLNLTSPVAMLNQEL
jgi:hypothetical protein